MKKIAALNFIRGGKPGKTNATNNNHFKLETEKKKDLLYLHPKRHGRFKNIMSSLKCS